MLGNEERAPVGPHDGVLLGRRCRGCRHVFELEGDHVHAFGEGADGVEVVVGGVDFDVGDLAGGRVVFGGERVDAVAEAPGGDGEHAAQLAAAQYADGRAGENQRD